MDLTINTNVTQVKLSGAANADKAEKAQEAAADSNVQSAAEVQKYDTVELSAQAEQYLEENADNSAESADESAISLSEYSSDTSSDDIDALYTYSDDELADLLRDGDITQAEYNAEMAKRGAGN